VPRAAKYNYWAETFYYPPELEPLLDFSFKYLYGKKQEWHNLYFELCRKNRQYADLIMKDFSFFQKLCRKRANVEEKVVQWHNLSGKRESKELQYNRLRMLLTGASPCMKECVGEIIPLCSKRNNRHA